MPSIIDGRWDIPHPRVAAAVRGGPPDDAERLARVADLQPERMADSLAFLAGYAPGILDAILTATETCAGDLFPADEDALEPYCTACGAKAGVFIARGPNWLHYAGDPARRTARPFDADHDPVIGWRPATDGPAFVAFLPEGSRAAQ